MYFLSAIRVVESILVLLVLYLDVTQLWTDMLEGVLFSFTCASFFFDCFCTERKGVEVA